MSTQLEIVQCWDEGVRAALQSNFDKAMEAFEKIVDPRCYVLFDMGTICLRKGSFQCAVKVFRTERGPFFPFRVLRRPDFTCSLGERISGVGVTTL